MMISPTRSVVVAEMANCRHELLDDRMTVVARDASMEVEPDALDGVVVRAIGGQEMEDDEAIVFFNGLPRLLTVMDDVVVENQMDFPFSGMALDETVNEGDEEVEEYGPTSMVKANNETLMKSTDEIIYWMAPAAYRGNKVQRFLFFNFTQTFCSLSLFFKKKIFL